MVWWDYSSMSPVFSDPSYSNLSWLLWGTEGAWVEFLWEQEDRCDLLVALWDKGRWAKPYNCLLGNRSLDPTT